MIGQMVAYTAVSGSTIKCTALAGFSGQKVKFITANMFK